MLALSTDDFLWYVDLALDAMTSIVRDLGDEAANARPDLPGANSPYVILTHCLGVMSYWGGGIIAGRDIVRDRDTEFRAQGPVDELLERTKAARRQLADDLATLDSTAPPRQASPAADAAVPLARTQGGVALHIYQELAQHLGQLELTRDILVARAAEPPATA